MYESFAIVSIEGKVYDCWRTLGQHYWRLGSTAVPPKNKHSSRLTYAHTCLTWILHDVIWNQLSVAILSDPGSVCIFWNTSICSNIYTLSVQSLFLEWFFAKRPFHGFGQCSLVFTTLSRITGYSVVWVLDTVAFYGVQPFKSFSNRVFAARDFLQLVVPNVHWKAIKNGFK